MQKLNFKVEVEVNGQFVHAHVKTLAEARALIHAFKAVNDKKASIFDYDIYVNEDATDAARAEFEQYTKECYKALLVDLA